MVIASSMVFSFSSTFALASITFALASISLIFTRSFSSFRAFNLLRTAVLGSIPPSHTSHFDHVFRYYSALLKHVVFLSKCESKMKCLGKCERYNMAVFAMSGLPYGRLAGLHICTIIIKIIFSPNSIKFVIFNELVVQLIDGKL